VSLPENPFPLGLPSFFSDYWDPIWDAVQETETCVCMHVGTSSSLPRPSPEAPFTVSITLVQNNAAECFVNLAFSPVLAKFPRIQFMLSEGGIAWIPGVLERADRMWEIHGKWDTFPIKQLPSETFRSNFYCCWVGERLGMQLRHEIGLERITWEADYPHAETPWPHSQDFLDIAMADVPADEAALITHGNARRAFRWPA
jgi:predicted TIM-barrel fold metal-dependent hydrolase